jgi:uncharacterized protein
VLGAILPL